MAYESEADTRIVEKDSAGSVRDDLTFGQNADAVADACQAPEDQGADGNDVACAFDQEAGGYDPGDVPPYTDEDALASTSESTCDGSNDLEDKPQPSTLGHNKTLGYRGESAACLFLERRGYEILQRNWTCPAGEADIIAKDEGCLVFVEVKTRTGLDKGMPEEAVDSVKRNRYESIAGYYLHDYPQPEDMTVRFDVIGIMVISPDRAFVRHHINAFGVA